ncbi:MAG: D-3-phosphoglycerate dehydrogenase [Acidobacteria bacterium]|nr:D-3-phosphoglycerate dehydrogenase [Acidobacteriota bacterium]
MRVLVADKFEKSGIEGLKAAGCEVSYDPDLKGAALSEAISRTGADVLVVRSTEVTEPMLDAGRLSLVVRAGAGYNTIDVKAASRRGIYVSNCPGKNSIAVAELAFGMIIAMDRRIPDNVADLRAGRWNKKEFSKSRGIYGRTLGLLGFGNIGQEMAKRAQAFGMNLVIWSEIGVAVGRDGLPIDLPILVRFRPASGSLIEPIIQVMDTPAAVAEKCDILSVHLAANAQTRGIVNADVLGRLKPGSYFLNTARADVVDYGALEQVVKEKNIRVALDVYPGEPAGGTAEFDFPMAHMPGVYGTHHIGASTDQAQEAIAAETVHIIRTYKEKGVVPNVVNLARQSPASHSLIVRHHDRPGVLAGIFQKLRDQAINAQETENIIFDGAQAAVARINLDTAPAPDLLEIIKKECPDILDLSLVKLDSAREA